MGSDPGRDSPPSSEDARHSVQRSTDRRRGRSRDARRGRELPAQTVRRRPGTRRHHRHRAAGRPGARGVPLRAPQSLPPKGLVGQSPSMAALLSRFSLIGPTRRRCCCWARPAPARSWSRGASTSAVAARAAPFVAVNCAALRRDAARERALRPREGRLHRRGRAHAQGRFEARRRRHALPRRDRRARRRRMQVKLLRVLQERRVRARRRQRDRAGRRPRRRRDQPRPARRWSRAGRFRADLYYRLNVVRASTCRRCASAARTSRSLVEHFLPRTAQRELGRRAAGHRARRCRCSAHYDWPGNVRELENVVERALVLSRGAPISELLLSSELVASSLPPGTSVVGIDQGRRRFRARRSQRSSVTPS